jgi:hypothetical protein
MLSIDFAMGNGVYAATRAPSKLDYYQSRLYMRLSRVHATLKENKDYRPVHPPWQQPPPSWWKR